jgi:hypothetical protein
LGKLKKRKIMKNYFKYLIILGVSLMFTSCLVEDTAPSENNDKGPNLAGFVSKTQNLSAVSDGNEYIFDIRVQVKGPTLEAMSGDVTFSVAVDASASTAIEGTHYRLTSNTMTLTSSNNYLGILPITVITDGIIPPLDVAPILTLVVTDASGNNIVANGDKLKLTFVYQCFADMSGTYLVTNDGCGTTGSCYPAGGIYTEITANPDGSWHIDIGDGGFLGYSCTGNCGLDNFANIVELCGDILPSNDLDFADCCSIGNIVSGSWDAENGILTMSHTQEFTGNWAGAWNSTYTRQ